MKGIEPGEISLISSGTIRPDYNLVRTISNVTDGIQPTLIITSLKSRNSETPFECIFNFDKVQDK